MSILPSSNLKHFYSVLAFRNQSGSFYVWQKQEVTPEEQEQEATVTLAAASKISMYEVVAAESEWSELNGIFALKEEKRENSTAGFPQRYFGFTPDCLLLNTVALPSLPRG